MGQPLEVGGEEVAAAVPAELGVRRFGWDPKTRISRDSIRAPQTHLT